MNEIQQIKQRFSIIGNSPELDRAIDIARQVAPTDLSVLITGESGVGKEAFPQIIHQYSARKHGPYIAMNCGAIPEGTIDSELFGHEKGAFTGAHDSRKGYFEVANSGTIFLDEVADLPLSTQVRLLRVLETGEFIKVGSSKVLKTNVRVIAATNVNIKDAIQKGRFREDLYYRLNTVPIQIPNLRDRKEDIILLLRKFAQDFADKYRMPAIVLDDEARHIVMNYRWPGNIRQLKNVTEQISVIEKDRNINAPTVQLYLPDYNDHKLPALYRNKDDQPTFASEREILYKILFDLKNEFNDMKKLVNQLLHNGGSLNEQIHKENAQMLNRLYGEENGDPDEYKPIYFDKKEAENNIVDTEEIVEESLSIEDKEIELIQKALEKHSGKRKNAATELGISERTLYRKIKEYNIE
jgi:transcriptional regulator with PAS, ATPase and Fis domain